MILLYFLGPMMEQWWGAKRFVAFYLICGMAGAIFYTILGSIPDLLPGGHALPLVGASGSVFGIIIGCATVYPNKTLRLLFLPFEFKLRTFCYFFLAIAALKVLAGSYNAGPKAVMRWLDLHGDRPMDEFIELVPYTQTRGYMRKVTETYARYLYLYKNEDYRQPLVVHRNYLRNALNY